METLTLGGWVEILSSLAAALILFQIGVRGCAHDSRERVWVLSLAGACSIWVVSGCVWLRIKPDENLRAIFSSINSIALILAILKLEVWDTLRLPSVWRSPLLWIALWVGDVLSIVLWGPSKWPDFVYSLLTVFLLLGPGLIYSILRRSEWMLIALSVFVLVAELGAQVGYFRYAPQDHPFLVILIFGAKIGLCFLFVSLALPHCRIDAPLETRGSRARDTDELLRVGAPVIRKDKKGKNQTVFPIQIRRTLELEIDDTFYISQPQSLLRLLELISFRVSPRLPEALDSAQRSYDVKEGWVETRHLYVDPNAEDATGDIARHNFEHILSKTAQDPLFEKIEKAGVRRVWAPPGRIEVNPRIFNPDLWRDEENKNLRFLESFSMQLNDGLGAGETAIASDLASAAVPENART